MSASKVAVEQLVEGDRLHVDLGEGDGAEVHRIASIDTTEADPETGRQALHVIRVEGHPDRPIYHQAETLVTAGR